MDTNRRAADNPANHHYAPSLSGTSLQIPQGGQFTYRSDQSPSGASSARSEFDQTKSRNTTRHSGGGASSTMSSNWTSASNASGKSSVNPAFYPSSGFPKQAPQILARPPEGSVYPGSGYPISAPGSGSMAFNSAFGYPTSAFPCCDMPGVTDLGRSQLYPGSEFPADGLYPGGDLEGQDGGDGCQPFIGAYLMHAEEPPGDGYPDDGFGSGGPLAGVNTGGYPGGGLGGYQQAEYGGQTVMSSALDPLGYVHGYSGYPT